MNTIDERQRNHTAYRRLKGAIDQSYAPGRFVAISEGQVTADAARLEELCSLLRAVGKDPGNVLIVQAGADYPETAIIFLRLAVA